jgi:hypothetical protein
MKVVCINNIELGKDPNGKPRHKKLSLTIGQTYEAEPDGIILGKVEFYMLEEDNNKVVGIIYPTHYFVTIDVWREMQINKLI